MKIFEMKFPPDTEDDDQNRDYRRIAGGLNNYEVLTPGEGSCNCNPDRDRGERDEDAVPSLSRVEQRAPLANPQIPEVGVPQPGGIIWGEPEGDEEPSGLPIPGDEEEIDFPEEELPIAARGACIATWTAGGAGGGAIVGGGLGAAGGFVGGAGVGAVPGGAGGMEAGAVLGGGEGFGMGWLFCGS